MEVGAALGWLLSLVSGNIFVMLGVAAVGLSVGVILGIYPSKRSLGVVSWRSIAITLIDPPDPGYVGGLFAIGSAGAGAGEAPTLGRYEAWTGETGDRREVHHYAR